MPRFIGVGEAVFMKKKIGKAFMKTVSLLLTVFLLLQPSLSAVLIEGDTIYNISANAADDENNANPGGDFLDGDEDDGDEDDIDTLSLDEENEGDGVISADENGGAANYSIGLFSTISFLDVVTAYKQTLEKQTASGYVPVVEGSSVSFNDLLRLTYTVDIKDELGDNGEMKLTALWDAIRVLETGATYYVAVQLPIPAGLKYVNDGEKEIFINIGTNEAPDLYYFATLYPDPNGDGVFLRFKNNGFWKLDLSGRTKVEAGIYVACELDENITVNNGKSSIILDAQTTLTITPTDPLPTGHTLTKSGKYVDDTADANTNQVIEWTVTYTATSALSPPITFYDRFISTYHTFVVGSMKMKVNTGSAVSITPNVGHATGGSDETVLSYVYNNAVNSGDTIVFTYRTMLTNEALSAADYYTPIGLANTSEMRVRDTTYVQGSGIVLVTQDVRDKHWLAKKVTNADSGKTLYGKDIIGWEVDIRAFDLGFSKFDLYDTIPTGLSLLTDTVKISVDGGKTYQLWSTYSSALLTQGNYQLPDNSASVPAFKLTLPTDGNGKYYSSYRVQYDTQISTNSLISLDGNGYIVPSEFDNRAWLGYEWLGGVVLGPPPKPPVVELTGVGVDVPIILKEGKYDSSTHKITWTVTVNPFNIEIQDGTITDFFDNNGITPPSGAAADRNMKFLPETFKSDINSATSSAYFTLNSEHVTTATGGTGRNSFSVIVNGLGTKTAKFTFETEVLDQKNTEFNSTKTYTNTAEFAGKVILYNTSGVAQPAISVKDKDSASPSVVSTVLAKSAGSYVYTDNSITWTVTVNQNKMPMTGASIVDTIPQYLFVDTGTITVKDSSGTVWGTDKYSVSYIASGTNTPATKASAVAGNTILTINLGNLTNEQLTITFKTFVLLNDDDRFKSASSVGYTNSVDLIRTNLTDKQTVTASRSVTNTILGKNGAFVMDGNSTTGVTYTVTINPHGMALTDYTLTDILPKGLVLVIDSVKLWETTVSSTGTITKSTNVVAGWDDSYYSYEYANGTRTLTITLPGNKPYVLTYDCTIDYGAVSGSSFTNSIAFDNTVFSSNSGAKATGSLTYGGWAISRAKGSVSLQIAKKDSKDGAVLKGVKFQLLTKFTGDQDPTVIMEGETDDNGVLKFYPLNFLRTYWIREVSGITGYSDLSTAYAVDKADASNKKYELDNYSLHVYTTDAVNGIKDIELNIFNGRDEYDFAFIKTDTAGNGLSGATFKITDNTGFIRTSVSGSGGVVAFTNIPWGIYTLVETNPPYGYYQNTETFTVTIDKTGNYFITGATGAQLTDSNLGKGQITNAKKPPVPVIPTPTPTPPPDSPYADSGDPTPSPSTSPTPSPSPSPVPSPSPSPSLEPSPSPSPDPLASPPPDSSAPPEASPGITSASSVTPDDEPSAPPYTPPEVPPTNPPRPYTPDPERPIPPEVIPANTRHVVDNIFEILDDEGVPLGAYIQIEFSEETGLWEIFDVMIPLGFLPATGGAAMSIILLSIGLMLVGLGLSIGYVRKSRKSAKRMLK